MGRTTSKFPGHTLDAEDVTDFIMKYSTYTNRDDVERWVKLHEKYKTILVVYDEGIAGICRWNILPSGKDAHILDLIIREDHRGTGLLQRMLLQGLKMYPTVENLKFEMGYDDGTIKKPLKTIPIKEFFRHYRRRKNVV